MKTTIISILSILILASCTKPQTKEVMVVKDCTGSYLRFAGEDFLICNDEKVEKFADGAMVRASFNKTDSCTGTEGPICMMYHEFSYLIKIKTVE